ncbi:MAG: hypothetical protein ACAH05_06885, partial [Methylophilus sp.]
TMWWKRRPSGRLIAAPPKRQNNKITRNVTIITLVLGILFPLLGASMILVLIFDTLWQFANRKVKS